MTSLRRALGQLVKFPSFAAMLGIAAIIGPARALAQSNQPGSRSTVEGSTSNLPAATVGVWRQTGGGMFLTITAGAADFYHFTRFICYKDEPSSGKPLAHSYVRYRLEDEGSKLTLFRHDLGDRFDGFFGRSEFRRVSALPAGAVAQPGNDPRFKAPEFIFEIAWHHFDEQFGFFKQRGFDWREQYSRFRPQVTAEKTWELATAVR